MDAPRHSSAESSESIFGSKHFRTMKDEQKSKSALEGLCRSEFSSGNSAIIEQEETDPSVNWKLPPVSPHDVYRNLSSFNFRALSQIKIK